MQKDDEVCSGEGSLLSSTGIRQESSILNDYDSSQNEKVRQLMISTTQKMKDLVDETQSFIERVQDENNAEAVKLWKENPTSIYEEMEELSNNIGSVWTNHYQRKQELEDEVKLEKERQNLKFKNAYMEAITSAFGDELDDIRNGKVINETFTKKKKRKNSGNVSNSANKEDEVIDNILDQDNIILAQPQETGNASFDIDVMVSCLESGMSVWREEEKELFLLDREEKDMIMSDDTDRKKIDVSIHEKRRLELFG